MNFVCVSKRLRKQRIGKMITRHELPKRLLERGKHLHVLGLETRYFEFFFFILDGTLYETMQCNGKLYNVHGILFLRHMV